jgi:hypothetical protein
MAISHFKRIVTYFGHPPRWMICCENIKPAI